MTLEYYASCAGVNVTEAQWAEQKPATVTAHTTVGILGQANFSMALMS